MKQNPIHQDWQPCPPGVLQEKGQKSFLNRRRFMHIAAAFALLTTAGGSTVAGYYLARIPTQAKAPEINCVQVHQNMMGYMKGNIRDNELKKRITAHLVKCKGCKNTLRCLSCRGSKNRKATLKPRPICPPENPPQP